MNVWMSRIGRVLAVVLPLGAGAIAISYSGMLKSVAANKSSTRQAVPVRVITLAEVDLIPRVSGYGVVTPSQEWRAVARVEGEIIETSPQLANGILASAGAILLRIDDTDLQLSLAQLDAQRAALSVKDRTLESSLALALSDLTIAKNELKRQESLKAQGIATQSALDQAARTELGVRSKVTDLENQLALNEAERKILSTQRASSARSLEFTAVAAPFDVRIGEVGVELGQFVTRGSTLFTADGTATAEVTAQFSMGKIGPIVRALGSGGTVMDLSATVQLSQAGHRVEWPAAVARVGELMDARTQSTNIIVQVDQPVTQAEPGKRPPLRRDTFVEVILKAPPRKSLVAPESAIRGNRALVVNPDGKLETRNVDVAYSFDGLSVISAGLAAGDQLVVTDPAIAVPGMAAKPVEDNALVAELARKASAGDVVQ